MLCQNCKSNTATVYYKESINGRTAEYALCPACAAKLKLTAPLSGASDDDPLASLFAGMLTRPRQVQDQKRCPTCGALFKELAAAGKMSCPGCYDAFADELAPTIKQLHGSAKSRGRAPHRFGEKRQRELELAQLRADLKSAIDTQEFEKAAELRDKIRTIEGGM